MLAEGLGEDDLLSHTQFLSFYVCAFDCVIYDQG